MCCLLAALVCTGSTFFDFGYDVAIDSAGENVYVVGYTNGGAVNGQKSYGQKFRLLLHTFLSFVFISLARSRSRSIYLSLNLLTHLHTTRQKRHRATQVLQLGRTALDATDGHRG